MFLRVHVNILDQAQDLVIGRDRDPMERMLEQATCPVIDLIECLRISVEEVTKPLRGVPFGFSTIRIIFKP